MQDTATEQKSERDFKIKDLSLDDQRRLVGAFAWLLKEDKKQNPRLYKFSQLNKYD